MRKIITNFATEWTNFATEWIAWVREPSKSIPKTVVYLISILQLEIGLLADLWELLQLLRYRKKLIKKLNSAKTLDEWIEGTEQIMWFLGPGVEEYREAHR